MSVRKIIIYSFTGLVVLFSIFPLYYLFLTSIKPSGLILSIPPKFFFVPTLEFYRKLFLENRYYAYYLNSFCVSSISTVIAVIIGSFASFAFVRYKFLGSRVLFFLVLLPRMALPIVSLIPVYQIGRALHLLDTRSILILVYVALQLPLAVFIIRSFFEVIPKQIQESAELDGCSPLGIFVRIILPLSGPGLLATSIVIFVFNWNEFLYALALTSFNARTATVALTAFIESEGKLHWGELSTLSVCMTIPALFFMVFLKKYLIQGIFAGAVKG